MRTNAKSMLLGASALGALLSMVHGCDPVLSDEQGALGGNNPGESNGPTHRRGQPCLVCHGGSGPGGTQFEIAGTIFQTENDTVSHDQLVQQAPAEGATVTLTDAAGLQYQQTTNTAGNFYFPSSNYSFKYPLHVSVTANGVTAPIMKTHIGRSTSCAECHTGTYSSNTLASPYMTFSTSSDALTKALRKEATP